MVAAESAEVGWAVVDHHGSAAELHQLELPVGAGIVHHLMVGHPALVLGSTQASDLIDAESAARAGYEVAKRRSGGGVVSLREGDTAWVDVVIPPTDPRWDDDVSRSPLWLGDAWVRAMATLGVTDGVTVHRSVERRDDGRVVCFAGVGPGEVSVGGAKLVGISQRRGRWGARFQMVVNLRWAPDEWLWCVRDLPDCTERAALAAVSLGTATTLGLVPSVDHVVAAFAHAL